MDNSSLGAGIFAVFAVSGGVVLLASKVHKHLLSDFMKKIEFEISKYFAPFNYLFIYLLLKYRIDLIFSKLYICHPKLCDILFF